MSSDHSVLIFGKKVDSQMGAESEVVLASDAMKTQGFFLQAELITLITLG